MRKLKSYRWKLLSEFVNMISTEYLSRGSFQEMGFLYKAKAKVKKILKKILKTRIGKDSFLFTRSIISDQVFCQWKFSNDHQQEFLSNKEHYLCIRIYDITNSNSNKDSTCVMKEVKLKKESSECLLSMPVSDGNLLLEIGYREPYGKWFLLASSLVTLVSRPLSTYYGDDSWFYSSQDPNQIEDESIHDRVYQLSKPAFGGGSESINKRRK